MKCSPLLLLLLLPFVATSPALAQISPEEAQRRLEERRAQAATRPADTSVIPDLKFQIATLQHEVARLKTENAALTQRLADTQAAATAASTASAAASATRPAPDAGAGPTEPRPPVAATMPAATTAKPTGKLQLGMSLQDANAAMGFDGKLVGEGRGWQQYEWQLPAKSPPQRSDAPPSGDDHPRSLLGVGNTAAGPSVFARFEGGLLTSYAKR